MDLEIEKGTSKKNKITPLLIHISILLLLFVIIGFFIFSDFSLTSSNKNNLIVVGNVVDFYQEYSGDLKIYSRKFNLNTSSATFDGNNKNFEIGDFKGIIYLINESIIFEGISKNISFDKNYINNKYNKFRLKSQDKTKFDIYINQTKIIFKEGNFKFNDGLNVDFINSSFYFNGLNSTIIYDGSLSINGNIKSFIFNNPSEGIEIKYEEIKT